MFLGILFICIGLLALLGGLGIWAGSKSAVHEIAALVTFLIGWVTIIGGSILFMLSRLAELMAETRDRLPKPRTVPTPMAPTPVAAPTIPAPRQVNPTAQ